MALVIIVKCKTALFILKVSVLFWDSALNAQVDVLGVPVIALVTLPSYCFVNKTFIPQ